MVNAGNEAGIVIKFGFNPQKFVTKVIAWWAKYASMRDTARKIKNDTSLFTTFTLNNADSLVLLLSVRQGEKIGPSLGNMFTEGSEITRVNKKMGRENVM